MASAGSGEQSNVSSSDSIHTARFGGGSPVGDDSFAAPTIVTGPRVEVQPTEDADGNPVAGETQLEWIPDKSIVESALKINVVANVLGSTAK